ncbi:ModD protein [Azospirillum halopraeferens]|uniref:ModD protein n=1 Tax=Azospirillum halopraeferens TaxID=34010 RepID=UPI0004215DA0|nr:ModD protein [Azospirillum halopraeferens]
MHILPDAVLDALLAQDAPYGDLTTATLGIAARPGRITFAARDAMVLCAADAAARMLERCGARVERAEADGTALAAGAVFLVAEGPAGGLHRGWKVAQTLVEYASGIATRARRIVEAAPGVSVACTRKNFPGTKEVAVKAVLAGGAVMHRLGLSETLLVFAEHRAFLAGSPAAWMADLKRRAPERKVVVEVSSVDEALAMAAAGADVLQLEKLSPADVATVVAAVAGGMAGGMADGARDGRPRPAVAAAGGVSESNAAAYAATGCDVLVTSAPFFGRPCDVKVTLGPA